MKADVNSLEDLMRLKKYTVVKLSEETGISQDTIRRRLKDHDWRMTEADLIIEKLKIPSQDVYLYFFKPLLEQNSNEVT